jgi:F5/8 type C domain
MPVRLISVAALALSLASCTVYDPSLLDGAVSAPLSSAGDGSVAGTPSGGTQGGAGRAGNSAGSTGIAGTGGGYGGAEDAGGAADFGGASTAGDQGGAGAATGGDDGIGGSIAGTSAGGAGAGAGGAGAGGAGANGAGTAGSSAAGSGGSSGAVSAAGAAGSAPALVQLAAGKKSSASTYQVGNENAKGNDGDVTTKWCASSGTFPQWWRVDLGATHSLSSFSVTWEHPDRNYTYKIETSQNDSVYAVQASLSGTGSVQGDSFPANTSARYVRVTVTDAAPGIYAGTTYPTWACFFELSITGS